MDREYLKNNGLLEQYVLGLTNRKESLLVQKALEEDPEVKKEYERLKEELGSYALSYGLEPPSDGRAARASEDFEELDHEMMMSITEENLSLRFWRSLLSVACLLLLAISFFTYRQSKQYHSALITEKARHAQDQNSFGIELEHLHEEAVDLTKLATVEIQAVNGLILLHHLHGHDLALLDLSHLAPLEQGDAYFIFLEGKRKRKPALILEQDELHHLHALELGHAADTLKIFRWAADVRPPNPRPTEDLIAGLALR